MNSPDTTSPRRADAHSSPPWPRDAHIFQGCLAIACVHNDISVQKLIKKSGDGTPQTNRLTDKDDRLCSSA